ncbi:MAG: metallophosphoesterase [Roseburia sp.]|nr:metallophosphoesterase [Roseburia sp.]
MKEIGKKILIIILLIVVFALALWIIWDNQRIVVTPFEVESEELPESFDGYRIVQVSDLHNDEFGKDNEKLLAIIKEAKPDIIAITGDLLDSRRTSVEKALNFVTKAAQIAPCYYVTGNHESRMKEEYEQLEKAMISAGVIVLRNEKVVLEKEGEQITIVGLDDPRFVIATDRVPKMEAVIGGVLEGILEDVPEEMFTLLLSHRPEMFAMYCNQGVDVVLSGHVHGGQVRIPYIGGIIGPGQGILPDYDAGIYMADGTTMVLSRGLGQSIIPFRVNNPPELVVVTLKSRI